MMKPLNDHVIVKALTEDKKSEGGIILPDTITKEKPEKGEVIAAGPGKQLDNGQRAIMSVKPGDKILFTKYAPNEIKIEGSDYLVLSESDILAIIE